MLQRLIFNRTTGAQPLLTKDETSSAGGVPHLVQQVSRSLAGVIHLQVQEHHGATGGARRVSCELASPGMLHALGQEFPAQLPTSAGAVRG